MSRRAYHPEYGYPSIGAINHQHTVIRSLEKHLSPEKAREYRRIIHGKDPLKCREVIAKLNDLQDKVRGYKVTETPTRRFNSVSQMELEMMLPVPAISNSWRPPDLDPWYRGHEDPFYYGV